MASVESRDGTQISYDALGEDGPLLVCVFGATCFRNFAPVKSDARRFAKVFTVINYDRRGRGDSFGHDEWSLQAEVEDIEALIDAHGGKALVYGHSSGGVLALEAARRLDNKVTGVAVYDVAYCGDDQDEQEYAELSARIDRKLRAGQNAAALKTFLRGVGMPKIFAALMPLSPGWRAMKQLAPTLRYDVSLTSKQPQPELMAQISVPALVMVGEKNPKSLHQVYEVLRWSIPHSSGRVVPGQDHLVSAKILLQDFNAFAKENNLLAQN